MEKLANQGKPWTKVEHDKLQEYLDQKKSEEEIGALMQRTKTAIHAAVVKKIFLMRRQNVSDNDIAAKINWTVEDVAAVGKKEVKPDDNIVPRLTDKERIAALEARVEELRKLLVEIMMKK